MRVSEDSQGNDFAGCTPKLVPTESFRKLWRPFGFRNRICFFNMRPCVRDKCA